MKKRGLDKSLLSIVNYFTGKPVIIAIYEGEGIVQEIRRRVGNTDPSKADPASIRARYSDDSFEKAAAEGRIVRNVLHASDSPEEAWREISAWRKYFNR